MGISYTLFIWACRKIHVIDFTGFFSSNLAQDGEIYFIQ